MSQLIELPKADGDVGRLTGYQLRVSGLAARTDSLAYLVEKDTCYLSPSTKIATKGEARS